MLGVVLRAFKTLKRVIDVYNIQLGCFESYANNKKNMHMGRGDVFLVSRDEVTYTFCL